MSYILDSLKKSQKPVANVDFSDTKAERYSPVSGSSNLIMKVIIPLSLVIAFIIGYIGGNGLSVLPVDDINLRLIEQQALIKQESDSEQPLAWPEGRVKLDAEQYFNNPQAFNDQQKAIKIAKAQKIEQQKRRLIDAEKAAQQQALAEQVQQVIAAQGYVKSDGQRSFIEDSVTEDSSTISIDHEELSDVSPELLKAFQSAIDDDNAGFSEEQNDQPTDEITNNQPENNADEGKYADVKPLSQMPQWLQTAVPELTFSLHMFSSDSESSWLRLNDKDYFTGEISAEGIVIEQILPQKVILQYQGQQFSLKALSNW